MARFTSSVSSLFLVMLMFSFTKGDVVITPSTWCVAKPDANPAVLQANIDFVCDKVSCLDLQPGHVCFEPNDVNHHASYAMNLLYQSGGKKDCNFQNSGQVVSNDPSYGNCKYVAT